jgi:hypothetical protein
MEPAEAQVGARSSYNVNKRAQILVGGPLSLGTIYSWIHVSTRPLSGIRGGSPEVVRNTEKLHWPTREIQSRLSWTAWNSASADDRHSDPLGMSSDIVACTLASMSPRRFERRCVGKDIAHIGMGMRKVG